MKTFFLVGSILLSACFYQCGSVNKSQAASPDGARLIVSFISKGGGIDGKSLKDFEQLVKDFNTANKSNISYTVQPWGREGEKDYCFQPGQGKNFEKLISEVKKSLQGKELIRLKENAACRK